MPFVNCHLEIWLNDIILTPQPFIKNILIYPIKSLDPIELTETEIGSNSLRHDREFAIFNGGRFMNGKRTGRLNELKTSYDIGMYLVRFTPRTGGEIKTFHLLNDKQEIESYLTDFFKLDVSFERNTVGEFMDIPVESGITLLSEASLQSLQSDMPAHDLDGLGLRFRPNLMIGGVSPYWEEQLFGEPGLGVEIRIGDVKLIGVSPRARCNVPPRDPSTGVTDKAFIKSVMKSRAASIPAGSKLLSHGGFYQLTLNTYIPVTEKGKIIKVGDTIKVVGPVDLEMV